MTKGDEIRGLVREIENRVEAGILSVLEQGTPVKTAKCPAKTAESN